MAKGVQDETETYWQSIIEIIKVLLILGIAVFAITLMAVGLEEINQSIK